MLSKSNLKDMGFALNFFQGRGRINLTRTNLQFGQWETETKLLMALGVCLFRKTVTILKFQRDIKCLYPTNIVELLLSGDPVRRWG